MGLPGDSGRSNAEQVKRTELSFRLPEGPHRCGRPDRGGTSGREDQSRSTLPARDPGGDGPLCRRSWSPVHRPARRQQL